MASISGNFQAITRLLKNNKGLDIHWMMSCLLKHFTRKIRSKFNRRFDVSNIILKIEIVYVNVIKTLTSTYICYMLIEIQKY